MTRKAATLPAGPDDQIDEANLSDADRLASAPEVGITVAQTRPGTRQRRSEREKAQAALDVATNEANRLLERRDSAKADLERLEAAYQASVVRRNYLADNPALQGQEVLPGV
jgi:excinuclease UvrABC nuclease subunit